MGWQTDVCVWFRKNISSETAGSKWTMKGLWASLLDVSVPHYLVLFCFFTEDAKPEPT